MEQLAMAVIEGALRDVQAKVRLEREDAIDFIKSSDLDTWAQLCFLDASVIRNSVLDTI